KDALDFSHGQLARRIQKNHVEGHDEPDERDCEMSGWRKDFLHHKNVSCPGSVVRCPWSVVSQWSPEQDLLSRLMIQKLQAEPSRTVRRLRTTNNGPPTT